MFRRSGRELSFTSNNSPTERKLPFLPGYTFDDKFLNEKHHKSHLFEYKNGIPIVYDFDVPEEVDFLYSQTEKLSEQLKATNELYNTSFKGQETASREPKWLSLEKKVLRFYAYFKEGVHESPVEQSRIRKCVIFYYLEDDTMHISEPKQDNSGIPQGALVKRHRFPRATNDGNGPYYKMEDLNVGREVSVYGKTFRIVDCDSFSRQFLESVGIEVPDAEPYPGDQYSQNRDELKKSMNPFIKLNPMDQDFKKYLEYSFKGKRTNPSKVEKLATQKFLQFDRQVLRFYCVWDDRDSLYGDRRFFVLEYYLSDDTVKVSEVLPANSGYDPFPVFIKRQRVPKPKGSNEPTKYYDDTDFCIGRQVDVFSKLFFIYDCDEFTRQYYNEKYGITDLSPIEIKDSPKMPVSIDAPPYNGFGDEEDSLGSWKYLVIKPPKKDVKKYIENDKKQLRFGAVLDTDQPEDKGRRFILTYYTSDDTLSIFEPIQRNSGIIGGKFLQRSRVKGKDGNYYKPQDLYVGAKISINDHIFLLSETDEYTVKYMEDHPTQFEKADFNQVIKRMRDHITERNLGLRHAFRFIDTDRSGKISLDELRGLINRLEIKISEQEMITLMRHFDSNNDGYLDYNEFVYTMFPTDFSGELDVPQRKLDSNISVEPQKYVEAQKKENQETKSLLAFKIFMEKISNRRLLFQDTFRIIADKSPDGMVGEPEFVKAIRDYLHMDFNDEQVKFLADRFFPTNKKRISYLDFIKIVEGTSTWSYLQKHNNFMHVKQ
ncbi:hypothetical protein ABK040_010838 [Willaertia magna]